MFDDLVEAFDEDEVCGVEVRRASNDAEHCGEIKKAKLGSKATCKKTGKQTEAVLTGELQKNYQGATVQKEATPAQPEKAKPVLTRSQVLSLQSDLISYYNSATFQENLRDILDMAGDDEKELDAHRAALIRPFQQTVAKKYKLSPTTPDVQRLVVLSGELEHDHEVAMNMCKIAHLLQQTKLASTERSRKISR